MGLIDYFRNFFVFVNCVPDQNGKVLEETLAGSYSDIVKKKLFDRKWM